MSILIYNFNFSFA